MDGLITNQNLLVFLGFQIAAFSFLSQYLAFPKDLLSEMHRVTRNKEKHEMPCSCDKIISQDVLCDSANGLKAFFIEHDTITFVLLSYILYSMFLDLSLMLLLNCNIINSNIINIIITILPIILFFILGFSVLSGRKDKKRKWPSGYKYEIHREALLSAIFHISLLICFLQAYYGGLEKYALLFLINIAGLLIFMMIYLIIIMFRSPVSRLLGLWEKLDIS